MIKISVQVGKETWIVRGTKKGTIDVGRMIDMKDADGQMVSTFVPHSYFTTINGVCDFLLKNRITRSDATTFQQLKEVIIRESKKIRDMFDGFEEGLETEPEKQKPELSRRSRQPEGTEKNCNPLATPAPEPEPIPEHRRRARPIKRRS